MKENVTARQNANQQRRQNPPEKAIAGNMRTCYYKRHTEPNRSHQGSNQPGTTARREAITKYKISETVGKPRRSPEGITYILCDVDDAIRIVTGDNDTGQRSEKIRGRFFAYILFQII